MSETFLGFSTQQIFETLTIRIYFFCSLWIIGSYSLLQDAFDKDYDWIK
jgi:hypothetical protein